MQRSEFAPGRWNLNEALPAGEGGSFDALAKDLNAKTKRFEDLRPGLKSMSKDDLRTAISLYEDIMGGVARITSYSFMKYTADTKDQRAKSSLDRAEELQADIANRTIFLRLWWNGLSERKAEEMIPGDQDFRYFLSCWRKLKPHTLEEKVEQAVNIKNTTGLLGWSHHYDKIVSGFLFNVKVGGKPLKGRAGKPGALVVEEVTRLFMSPDARVREAAYRTLLAKYSENGGILGEVYRTIARDWRNENVKLRGYRSPISSRNLENDVQDEAVQTLLDVCRENASVFQDFFALKTDLLGMKRMNRFHIYAPLSGKKKRVSYEEAVKTVASAFTAFDSKVARLALRVFEKRHVDSTPRSGKRNGAYCMSVVPTVVPFLFLNFGGATRDVYTIAHESGHAVHSQLASSHSVLTFSPPLVLAETASVFGEMILFDKMMKDESDDDVKRQVLLEKISSMYATIGRQANFVAFEIDAHERIESGATVEDLCDSYLAKLRSQFGNAVTVPEEFRWEWTYIPHIYHTPFYCYAYAFGNLLSLALYDRYAKEGKQFVPEYLKVLSYGGSESPSKILGDVGIDLLSPAFWQSGFDVIRRMVRSLRNL